MTFSTQTLGPDSLDFTRARVKYQVKSGRLRLCIPRCHANDKEEIMLVDNEAGGQCAFTTVDGVRVWADDECGREYRQTEWVYSSECSTSDVHLTLLSRTQFFAHRVSHACLQLVAHLESMDVRGKSVVELGCGAALPSIICARLGATTVVASDFPDEIMLSNVQHNCEVNGVGERISVRPHRWGTSAERLLADNMGKQFDIVILADLLYELEHDALIKSLEAVLVPNGVVLISFQVHDSSTEPKLWDFFDCAQARGFSKSLIATKLAQPLPIWSDPSLDGRDLQAVFLLSMTR